jgi:hypothetical protein
LGIFSAIFGHTKLTTPDREQFFSIIGAAYNLEARAELRPTYKAGVVVNPVESTYFENLDSEMRTLLDVSGRATGHASRSETTNLAPDGSCSTTRTSRIWLA